MQWLKMGLDFELQENIISVLVLENQSIYTEFMRELLQTVDGGENAFVLYDNEKKMNVSKTVEVIFSPMLLDMNSKRIQQYLFSELKGLSDEIGYEKKERINTEVVDYLDLLSQKIPFPIRFKLELDEALLYKQYDVRIEYEEELLLEKVINYIQIQSVLCGTKVLIFINIKAYFTDEQLQEIYKSAFYNKIYLILLENNNRNCMYEEKYYIIDRDKCLITHD